MNTEIKELNIKAKRKLYYLEKTYGFQNLFKIKTEFKNKKEEREYLDNLKEFLFSSKYKYLRGGKIMSYRKSDYGKEYYYPINRSEWQEIRKLIKKRNKHIMKKQNNSDVRFFRKFRVNRKLIKFSYELKILLNGLKRKTK